MIELLLGTIFLLSLVSILVPKEKYTSIFGGNHAVDSIIGSILGSVSIGSPVVSYIIGGELLNRGISLIAVTSFLVAWVTVGLIQLPVEAAFLGRKFAIIRNLISFLFSMIVAVTTVILLGLI